MNRRVRSRLVRRWRALVSTSLALACLAFSSPVRAQGTAYLVRDIEERPRQGTVAVRSIAAIGERVFFAGNDAHHGFELWTSDGSEEGTRLVKDIIPGPRGAVASDLTAVGDVLYFVVDDGEHGRELWTSDGTEAGTHMVRDIAPGRPESAPRRLTPLGDRLFFVADDGTHGAEIWTTDGSEAGTFMVADVRPGPGGARIADVVAVGDLVYFVANDGVHGSEPWSTDGTTEGTVLVADVHPGRNGSLPDDLVAFAGGVFFSADDGATGRELWRADGAGAMRVADVRPGAPGSDPASLVAAGDRLYFVAHTADAEGPIVWVTDGTGPGTHLLTDRIVSYDPWFRLTAAIGDTLYFVVGTQEHGAALWRTQGTDESTQLVADLRSRACSDEFRAMAVRGNDLFLIARSPESDDELWISDGTGAGTRMVKDIFPGTTGSRPGSLAVAGDVLFFAAIDGLHGRELWKSDGTEQGTVLVRDILDGGTDSGVQRYAPFFAQGKQVLFSAMDGTVWQSDGTSAGTAPLGLPENLAVTRAFAAGDFAVLRATDLGSAGRQGLWQYDGTTFEQRVDFGNTRAGIDDVAAVGGDPVYSTSSPGPGGGSLWRAVAGSTTPLLLRSFSSWSPSAMVGVRGDLYFNGGDTQTGSELWKTDGTPAGTVLVADISPGSRSAVYNDSHVGNLGRRILIAADDGVHGLELWVTDGTSPGTRLLRDIAPGSTSSWPGSGGRLAGVVHFSAQDASGAELWRTDGTTSGTFRLVDIAPGSDSSRPSGFVRLGDVLLFAAYRPDTGRELWRTDGTAAGTWLVADAQPDQVDDGILPMVVVGDVAYFSVMTPNRAVQLWVTDGTPAGTRLAADVSSGEPAAGIATLENRQGQLFFVANDTVHGDELWALSCGNGELDELEACDDGAENGSPSSCCSGACTLREIDGEACDPIDGSLAVHRARVQYDGAGPADTGRIVVDGELEVDPESPLSLVSGLVMVVRAAATLEQRVEWSATECRTRAGGVLRCARSGAVASFRPVAGTERYRFALNVGGLAIDGPVAPGSLEVVLRTAGGVDRAGSVDGCTPGASALVCPGERTQNIGFRSP